MSGQSNEILTLRREVAKLHGEKDRAGADCAALAAKVAKMTASMEGLNDAIAKKDARIASLEHQLSLHTGANVPSGKDPTGHENTKQFLKEADAYEAAKENGREPPASIPARPCGGRPGHPGRPHSVKPSHAV
ncbi:MAG: hypothetical protein J4G04_01240 [Nitrosopumilaceae archaeon]|nr:hypothetical protein [Nitrosopumilaceae archaeon]